MNIFQEYQRDLTKVAEWLPWASMPLAGVVENKDHSFLGAFFYSCEVKFDSDYLAQQIREWGSGWGIWCENRQDRCFVAFSWLPKAIHEDPAGQFDQTLNELAETMPLQRLYTGELLQYLFESIAIQKQIAFPAIPMYLDALLSLDQTYKLNPQEIYIDGFQIAVLVLNGFMEGEAGRLYAFLRSNAIPFRSVRRFLFLTADEATEEANRYMAGWCKNRRTIAPLLAYEDTPQKLCGFYAHLLVHWNRDGEALARQSRQIKEFLISAGHLANAEHAQPELWFAAIPGNFRAYLLAPMLQLDDIGMLFLGAERASV